MQTDARLARRYPRLRLHTILLSLLAAGIVHILATIAWPSWTSAGAVRRIACHDSSATVEAWSRDGQHLFDEQIEKAAVPPPLIDLVGEGVERLPDGKWCPIGAPSQERVEHLHNGKQRDEWRDLAFAQTVGITASVAAFVMVTDDG